MRDSTGVLRCIIGLGLEGKDVYNLLKYGVFFICSLVMPAALLYVPLIFSQIGDVSGDLLRQATSVESCYNSIFII